MFGVDKSRAGSAAMPTANESDNQNPFITIVTSHRAPARACSPSETPPSRAHLDAQGCSRIMHISIDNSLVKLAQSVQSNQFGRGQYHGKVRRSPPITRDDVRCINYTTAELHHWWYRGLPLERVIEKRKLIGKRCEMSVFNDPF